MDTFLKKTIRPKNNFSIQDIKENVPLAEYL